MSERVDEPEARADTASGERPSADPGADRQRAEVPRTESGPHSWRKYIPPFFKHYRTILVLLGLAAFLITWAFFLYPRRPPVYRPAPLTVNLSISNGVPKSAQIQVMPVRSDLFTMSIDFTISAPPNPSPPPPPPPPPPTPTYAALASGSAPGRTEPFSAHVFVDLPAGTTAPGCDSNAVSLDGCSIDTLTTDSTVSESLTDNPLFAAKESGVEYLGNNLWSLTFDFTIGAPELGWDANGVNLEAQLPAVTISQTNQNTLSPSAKIVRIPVSGNTNVSIIYGVPDATRYDWTGGQAPYSTTSSGAVSGYTGAIWYEHLSALSEPTPSSAVNNSAANADTIQTFIAGALVGVGGGAAVGAVQEALKRLENESSPAGDSEAGKE